MDGCVVPSPSEMPQWKMLSGHVTAEKTNRERIKIFKCASAVMINDRIKLESSSYWCRKWKAKEKREESTNNRRRCWGDWCHNVTVRMVLSLPAGNVNPSDHITHYYCSTIERLVWSVAIPDLLVFCKMFGHQYVCSLLWGHGLANGCCFTVDVGLCLPS